MIGEDMEVNMEHEHQWGAITHSRYAGTVHRPCLVVGCTIINLDFDEEDDDNEGTSCCGDYHYADCPIRTG
jgi:hypothetical protein